MADCKDCGGEKAPAQFSTPTMVRMRLVESARGLKRFHAGGVLYHPDENGFVEVREAHKGISLLEEPGTEPDPNDESPVTDGSSDNEETPNEA